MILHIPFPKKSSHILSSKIKQNFCGHKVLDEKDPVLQGTWRETGKEKGTRSQKLAVFIPFPFYQVSPPGLRTFLCHVIIPHLTESRGITTGRRCSGQRTSWTIFIMAHFNRNGSFSKVNTAIIDLITVFRECLLNDRRNANQIQCTYITMRGARLFIITADQINVFKNRS